MFVDMNNRPLKVGDFVLFNFDVKDKLESYGILLSDTKVVSCWRSDDGQSIYSKIGDKKKDTFCYLIDNPTSNELEIKNKILSVYNATLNSKLSSQSLKASVSNVYKKGDILFSDNNYYVYLYLGNIKVINSYDGSEISGHGYLKLENNMNIFNANTILSNLLYYTSPNTGRNVFIYSSDFNNSLGLFTGIVRKAHSFRGGMDSTFIL